VPPSAGRLVFVLLDGAPMGVPYAGTAVNEALL